MADLVLLVVCVGNVCRSPFIERLLAARAGGSLEVTSAGVSALVGSPMETAMAGLLREHGGRPDDFAARQLTPRMVREADLVLTATRAIRSRVLEESPGAMRRSFTLRELAHLLERAEPARASAPESAEPASDPTALLAWAAANRSRAAGLDLDVPDPFRGDEEVHRVAAGLMVDAVDILAARLRG